MNNNEKRYVALRFAAGNDMGGSFTLNYGSVNLKRMIRQSRKINELKIELNETE